MEKMPKDFDIHITKKHIFDALMFAGGFAIGRLIRVVKDKKSDKTSKKAADDVVDSCKRAELCIKNAHSALINLTEKTKKLESMIADTDVKDSGFYYSNKEQ